MVYDITNRNSFLNMRRWLEELQMNSDDKCVIMMVGNKLDLAKTSKRQVTFEEAKEFAEENQILFRETSAYLNYNVTDVFVDLIESRNEIKL